MIADAAIEGPFGPRPALATILTQYRSALVAHARWKYRFPEDKAQDLIQSFVQVEILQNGLIANAEGGKGRFRSYLLTALDRFAIDRYRHDFAAKRAPTDGRLTSLNHDTPQPRCAEPSDPFELEWARAVIDQTIRRVHQNCEQSSRPEVWGVFKARLIQPYLDQQPPEPYSQLALRLGFETPKQAGNALTTAKRMFRRCLQEVVAEYEPDLKTIPLEIDALGEVLGVLGAESWPRLRIHY
ncbi:MAG: hypothetical protein AAGA25_15790 [Planctomycetota bacterium]